MGEVDIEQLRRLADDLNIHRTRPGTPYMQVPRTLYQAARPAQKALEAAAAEIASLRTENERLSNTVWEVELARLREVNRQIRAQQREDFERAEKAAAEIERLKEAIEEAWAARRYQEMSSILFNALWPGHQPDCARYYDGRWRCAPSCSVVATLDPTEAPPERTE